MISPCGLLCAVLSCLVVYCLVCLVLSSRVLDCLDRTPTPTPHTHPAPPSPCCSRSSSSGAMSLCRLWAVLSCFDVYCLVLYFLVILSSCLLVYWLVRGVASSGRVRSNPDPIHPLPHPVRPQVGHSFLCVFCTVLSCFVLSCFVLSCVVWEVSIPTIVLLEIVKQRVLPLLSDWSCFVVWPISLL